jgi:hypothetical protein
VEVPEVHFINNKIKRKEKDHETENSVLHCTAELVAEL